MVLNSGIGQRGGGTMPVPRVGTFLTRGKAARQATMLTAITPDALVPQGHPIRRIKPMVHRALAQLSSTFDGMYADLGRASMPPEHLQLACLPMALYSVRGERRFCKRLEYAPEQRLLSEEHFSVDGKLLRPLG